MPHRKSIHEQTTKSIVVLLLARDPELKRQAAIAAAASGVCLTVAQTVDEALQTVCARRRELDLVVIDFDHGNRGITLLSALSMVRADLPILALTSSDGDHLSVLACANKAVSCLTKPINFVEFEIVIRALGDAKCSVEPICGKRSPARSRALKGTRQAPAVKRVLPERQDYGFFTQRNPI